MATPARSNQRLKCRSIGSEDTVAMNMDQTIPDIDEVSKLGSSPVPVCAVEGQSLNGLGMMIQQYLEQNWDILFFKKGSEKIL